LHNASKKTVITLFIICIITASVFWIWGDKIIPSDYHENVESLIAGKFAYDEITLEGISKVKQEIDQMYVDKLMFYMCRTESDGILLIIFQVREDDGVQKYKYVAHNYYDSTTFSQALTNAKIITVNDEGNRVGFYISYKKNTVQKIDDQTPEITEYKIKLGETEFEFIFAYTHLINSDSSAG